VLLTGTESLEAVKASPVPGVQKPLLRRKTVLEPFCGGAGKEEGEEISGSENETCLVAVGPPRHEPGSLPRRRGLPGMVSTAMQALRQLVVTTLSRDTTQMVKERGPQHRTA
jgi:hypothetical protein